MSEQETQIQLFESVNQSTRSSNSAAPQKKTAKKVPKSKNKPDIAPQNVSETGMEQGMEHPAHWTVSSLTQLLKATLSEHDVLGESLLVRGEITNLSPSSRGHVYFSLKDAQATLRGILWASKAARLPFELADGMEVFATGKLEIYAQGGSYSLVVERLEPVGIGALQLAYEQLKNRLTEEGLFDEIHKQAIPAFPQRIGIVTARTGAVIHDMLRVLRRKYPQIEVLLAPVAVQGTGAAEAIAEAIAELNHPTYHLDLLIVGRGGGSFEDLFCFSEEPVVRAIFDSRLPVITGVGHEPDFSLADAVADLSCSTPTAAAEAAVPDTVALAENLAAIQQLLIRNLRHTLTNAEQQLDRTTDRLAEQINGTLTQAQHHLNLLAHRLDDIAPNLLTPYQHHLHQLATALEALSPLATLQRGYWAVTNAQGHVIKSLQHLSPTETLTLHAADGRATAQILEIIPTSTP